LASYPYSDVSASSGGSIGNDLLPYSERFLCKAKSPVAGGAVDFNIMRCTKAWHAPDFDINLVDKPPGCVK
jgi:hypothetical protein